MTPYDVNIVIDDYIEKSENEMQEKLHLAIIQAYHTECFHRSKKLQPLEKYLKNSSIKKEDKKQQTSEDMFNVVQKLNAIFGGEVL